MGMSLDAYYRENLDGWCEPFDGKSGASGSGWTLKNYDVEHPPMYLYFAVANNFNYKKASDSRISHALKEKLKGGELKRKKGHKQVICKIGISKNPFQRLAGLKKDLNHKDIYLSDIYEITKNKNYKEVEDACLKFVEKDIIIGEWIFVDPHNFIHGYYDRGNWSDPSVWSVLHNYTISNHFEIMPDVDEKSPQSKVFFKWLIYQEIKGHKQLVSSKGMKKLSEKVNTLVQTNKKYEDKISKLEEKLLLQEREIKKKFVKTMWGFLKDLPEEDIQSIYESIGKVA